MSPATPHRDPSALRLPCALHLLCVVTLAGCALLSAPLPARAAASRAAVAAAVAPAALSAAVQQQLDAAVAAYAAGDLPRARVAFTGLAARRVPAAEFNLAVMHLRGELPRSDRAQAQRLLERAGRAGFVTAQLALAQALENGSFGPRQLSLAHDWYALAAAAGSVQAQLAMGTAHYLGRGRPQDAALAVTYFRQAATAGDEGAMYLLASMYEQGDGVERDRRLARYWYAAAAAAGDPAAAAKVRQMDELLTQTPT